MSVEIMSTVFKADIKDLPYEKDGKKYNAKASTVKLLLLAYADHANDEGAAAYPGYDKLEIKTALSRQGIANTLEAIKQNGFMVLEGKSHLDTNSYKINKTKLESLVKPLDSTESSHLTQPSQATRLKPSFNPKRQPSFKGVPPKPAPPKASDIPELVLFKEVVRHYPKPFQRDSVIEAVQKINARLLRLTTVEDLQPFFKAWGVVSSNDWSLVWLVEWAVSGQIPQKTNGNNNQVPQGARAGMEWLSMRKAQEARHG